MQSIGHMTSIEWTADCVTRDRNLYHGPAALLRSRNLISAWIERRIVADEWINCTIVVAESIIPCRLPVTRVVGSAYSMFPQWDDYDASCVIKKARAHNNMIHIQVLKAT